VSDSELIISRTELIIAEAKLTASKAKESISEPDLIIDVTNKIIWDGRPSSRRQGYASAFARNSGCHRNRDWLIEIVQVDPIGLPLELR